MGPVLSGFIDIDRFGGVMKTKILTIKGERGIVLLALLLLTFTTSVPAKASPASAGSPPAFSDGQWSGNFSIHADISFSGGATTVVGSFLGNMDFLSQAGALDGTFKYTSTAKETVQGGSGTASGVGTGTIKGTSDLPTLQVTGETVTIDATVQGIPVHTTQSTGAGIPFQVQLVSATCNQVVGDIATAVKNTFQSAGASANASGTFVAYRTGDLKGTDVPSYSKEAGDLLDSAEVFKKEVMAGNGIDFGTLNDLVSKAEQLALAIKKNNQCGLGSNKTYLTLVTSIVADIANFALDNPQYFTVGQLGRLAAAALRVGAIGSGAANPSDAAALQAKFAKEMDNRLTDAVNNNNCDQITSIFVATGAIGDSHLKQQATTAMNAVCGGS